MGYTVVRYHLEKRVSKNALSYEDIFAESTLLEGIIPMGVQHPAVFSPEASSKTTGDAAKSEKSFREGANTMSTLSITERLRLVAAISDLMLAGSVQAYGPPKDEAHSVRHGKTRRAA